MQTLIIYQTTTFPGPSTLSFSRSDPLHNKREKILGNTVWLCVSPTAVWLLARHIWSVVHDNTDSSILDRVNNYIYVLVSVLSLKIQVKNNGIILFSSEINLASLKMRRSSFLKYSIISLRNFILIIVTIDIINYSIKGHFLQNKIIYKII